jgi:peptide/nickel transport system substrate-binding protein
MWNSDFQYAAGMQLYDNLVRVNEKFEAVPALAESWEARSGVKEWVLKIRKGVTFHNGKTLTPADVVYSLNHHRGQDSKSMGRGMVAGIEDIKATGPDEVTITLASGNADLPYLLGEFHMMIGPEGRNFDGVGTGAFVVESFDPGVRMRTKRNPNDWRQDRGYVDTVEMLVINDAAARINALLSGSTHMVNRMSPTALAAFEHNPNFQVFNATGGTHPTFVMTCNAPPFDNQDLRLAMKYAVDREQLLKTIFRGYGKIGNDHPIPSHVNVYAADIPQRPYDPDKARFHLKKSGYTGPIVLTASDGAFGSSVEAAQLFQASAAKGGINFEIDRVPNDGYFSKYWKKTPFFASFFGGRPSADIALTAEFSASSSSCECQWNNPKFEQLLIAARAETDSVKRKQMYHDLQYLVHEEAGTLVMVFTDAIDVATKKARGFVPSPVNQFSAYRGTEQIWLADD